MARFWNLILFLGVCLCIEVNGQCDTTRRDIYGQFISMIKINHSEGIRLKWTAVNNTNNITVRYGNGVTMGMAMQGNEVVLTFDYRTVVSTTSPNTTTTTTTTATTTTTTTPTTKGNHDVKVVVDIWFRKRRSVSNDETNNSNEPCVDVIVPLKYTDRLCVNKEKCFPVKCPLSFLSASKFSSIPASNTILFSDRYCTLKKPEFWDQWIKHNFKIEDNKTEQYILDDPDKDGLVNLLEYYGINRFDAATEESIRSMNVADIGTNPNKADTDGDLLLDGFEFVHKMNPKVRNSINEDSDGDGLSNLDEQIRQTNPLIKDTDNDGIDDGEEVRRNTDPLDPSDRGQQDDSLDMASVKLTIGDHSGSHSERYVIKVGNIEHQSPGFGLVGTKTYVFKPGRYLITVQHVATKLSTPDYDYTAKVEKVSGNATVTVNDPQGLLGYHHESTWDFTVGRSAELIVTSNCPNRRKRSVRGNCGCLRTCEECRVNPECFWDDTFCAKTHPWIKPFRELWECPCTKCSNWYKEGKQSDLTWLSDLNANFKCPCRVTIARNILTEVDNPSNVTWLQDISCNPNKPGGCREYHPGAMGCIRSEAKSTHGAAQQCCYGNNGYVLPAGTPGAGTPDKYYASSFAVSWIGHYWSDVRPYDWCCQECGRQKECEYYINELRKGNTNHCSR